MKSAIYLNETNTQLVLTPENEWEQNVLKMVHNTYTDTYYAGFYECQGGWIRHAQHEYQKDSLIFRLQQKADLPEPQ
jgi:hypothetical protein